MSYEDIEQQRPVKKRRFFIEEPEDAPIENLDLHSDSDGLDKVNLPCDALPNDGKNLTACTSGGDTINGGSGFDVEMLSAFVGETLPEWIVTRLRDQSRDNLERAINLYLDGSWNTPQSSAEISHHAAFPSRPSPSLEKYGFPQHAAPNQEGRSVSVRSKRPPSIPETRYLGAFGATAWATRSGSKLIAYGDRITVERSKPVATQAKLGRGRSALSKREDVIVRIRNARGEEVARLEKDYAAWVSTLIDQMICEFDGSVVFAPEVLRTNDNIYLQLRCSVRRAALETGSFIRPQDTNRQISLFESKESDEEKKLRLRQVALVKLFAEINMQPTRVNAQTEKHKRQGLLRAAEVAERYEQQRASQPPKSSENGASSPPSDENEEGEELEQDQLDTLYKKAQSFDFNTPEAEPAHTFAMTLRKYQKQALFWMMGKEKDEQIDHKQQSLHPLWEEYAWPTKDVDEKELPTVLDKPNFYVNPYSGELSLEFPVQKQNCLGGILADEMGLGKTIEMLSLIHSHRADISGFSEGMQSVTNLPRLPKTSSTVEKAPGTTLVVAPMSLLAQWNSEAEKASKAGSLKTLVYYGSDKNINLQNLCCEANAAHAPNLVITSYGVVLSEFNQVAALGGNRGSHGGLFSLEFFRVILDEGHFIKNRLSKTAKACYEIKAIHRWVLTGTPIVNRLEDLFSLVHFLKVEPWSNFSFWKTFITVPFESKNFLRALDVVQTVLEPLVLRRTKDMQTPEGEPLVPLPPRTIEIVKLELSKPEKEVYDHIFARAKRTFNQNVEAGTLLKSYTTIFAQILRLRQSCCHPVLTRNKNVVGEEEDSAAAADIANGLADDMDLQVLIERFEADIHEQDANKFGANVLKQIQEEAEDECPICSEEPMNQQSVTSCWHSACKECLLNYIEHQRDKGDIPRCFNCRELINSRDVFEVVRHEPDHEIQSGPFAPATVNGNGPRITLRRVGCDASAKISGLIGRLKKLRREDRTMKSVVFSQFTSFLDLIEPALNRDRIPFLRFDGSMAQKQRAAVLEEFTTSKRGVVLLLSLRAGGVGLNLTAAKRVFMMDPWWSFAVEAQAIDRVHRMGQNDEVMVTRFIVEGSIEEKMLRIQERKKFIASSLGMMNDEEKKLQRIEDIKELLS